MNVPVPPLTPYLAVNDAAAAVEFYKQAFGAVQDGEPHYMPGTQKIMHVRLLINGGLIMLADDMGPMMGKPAQDPRSRWGTRRLRWPCRWMRCGRSGSARWRPG